MIKVTQYTGYRKWRSFIVKDENKIGVYKMLANANTLGIITKWRKM